MDGWTRDEDDDDVRALIPLLSNGLLTPFHVWENGLLLAEGRGAMLVFGSDGLMGCAMPNVRHPCPCGDVRQMNCALSAFAFVRYHRSR